MNSIKWVDQYGITSVYIEYIDFILHFWILYLCVNYSKVKFYFIYVVRMCIQIYMIYLVLICIGDTIRINQSDSLSLMTSQVWRHKSSTLWIECTNGTGREMLCRSGLGYKCYLYSSQMGLRRDYHTPYHYLNTDD